MCPSAPISVQLCINKHWSDEEVIQLLGGRTIGDLILANLITGVDPFNIEPSNSSETKSGFWRIKDECRIFTNTTCVGRKTTMEYYEGKLPKGNKTRWMMIKYQVECKTGNGFNQQKDYNSLCRVFLQNDWTEYEEQHYSASANVGGEYIIQLVQVYREPEETNLPSKNVLNRSLGQPAFSESVGEPLHENVVEEIESNCNFSIGDYLELNDLMSPETSSSSSNNSSCVSTNSYDYFDADAFLFSVGDEDNMRSDEEYLDRRFSIPILIESSQTAVRPSSPGSIHGNNNIVTEENMATSSLPRNEILDQGLPVSNEEVQRTRDDKSEKSEGSQTNQVADSSFDVRSMQGNGLKKTGKIAKLGKKYCCFGSF
ncbi:NAC domain-containing protein 26-like isoform X3 [Musa acuminata AAA Group]|uniref:NAC domain-containing protein 26-like isoform X3 n=1 Tax=Musa acuminata AAA Group TaxID=214697 RepID=UPI0031E1F9DA